MYRMIPTVRLVQMLNEDKSQSETNLISYELATRIYVPGTDITFEDVLTNLGYKEDVALNNKQLVKQGGSHGKR